MAYIDLTKQKNGILEILQGFKPIEEAKGPYVTPLYPEQYPQTPTYQQTKQNKISAVPSVDNGNTAENMTNIAPNLGTIFSQGLSTAGSTITGNIVKGYGLTEGLKENVAESLGGAAIGYAGNLLGRGISSAGGNSMLSRGIGQGIGTGVGVI